MKTVFFSAKALLLSLCLLAANAFANEVVNLNTADAQTLSRVLVNVGPAKAQAIIDYREQNGPFKSVEELANVRGIGLATVERNIGRMSVGGAAAVSGAAASRSAARPAQQRVAAGGNK
ncbi:MAG: ComEA family DNA-binding protein [Pseudomonadota bacterium]|nr:ComEA family DNA-binding protein [Pseudomonadota bacterium]